MKKLSALLLTITVAMSGLFAFAAADVTVKLDGEAMTFDVNPFIEEDRTLVPMRAIFEEAVGASVSWDDTTKTVIAAYENNGEQIFIVLQIGNNTAFVNGEAKELDVGAKIVNDRTFVPLRFVMEELGKTVTWDPDTYTVDILTK